MALSFKKKVWEKPTPRSTYQFESEGNHGRPFTGDCSGGRNKQSSESFRMSFYYSHYKDNPPTDLTAVWAASWAWNWLSFCAQTKPTTQHVETLFQPNRFHDWSMSLQSINQSHNSSDKTENHQGALKKPRDNVWCLIWLNQPIRFCHRHQQSLG